MNGQEALGIIDHILTQNHQGKPKDLQVDQEISDSLFDQQQLINYVDGNPLALKLVATTIQNLFSGNVQGFLAQNTFVFSSLQDLLAQQFDRLSDLQQQVLTQQTIISGCLLIGVLATMKASFFCGC